ncbi:MAG TPA: efflux RND transporter periplasmic adaptor subunit [Bacteroidales bacterium]|nr:efflux RND transporter periplasmic adaptor subunit [Bacteroidales bacterium]
MNTNRIFLFLIAAGFISLQTACTSKTEKAAAAVTDTVQAIPVKTEIVNEESVARTIEYTASLQPYQEVHLAPASPGRIEKINVNISDRVQAGQVLVLMDRTQLEQARLNMAKLESDYRRFDTLKKTGSIADQQFDQIKTAYDVAKTSYEFLKENTQLKAPFSGIISGKYFENGEIYSGSPVATIGKPAIVSIVQISQLKALVGISSSYFPLVTQGMRATVESELYPDLKFTGNISRIYPTIDNATKTFTAEISIENSQLKLRPGMFAKIKLDLGKGKAILVPNIAIIKQTGTNDMYVFVNKNNTAVKTPVITGRMFDDKMEILSGLSTGDEIVVVGQNKLEDKMTLQVK